MAKVKVSFDGRHNNETWLIDQSDDIGTPNLVISRSDKAKQIIFEPGELKRFYSGVGLCRAKDENQKDIYLTGF